MDAKQVDVMVRLENDEELWENGIVTGNNLLTWAAYDYIDPESGSSPSWDTPPMRTYTFGLEVKF